MSIADDIKKLGEDIVASYDMRVKAVGAIVKDTHRTLKEFSSEHKAMSAKLSADLAKGEEDRLKDFKAMMSEITKFVGGVVKETADLVKKFQAEHKEMAGELGDSLAKGETERHKAFKHMMSDIHKGIKDIETHVASKLKEFSAAHADMSAELKKELAEYVMDMVKETKKLMGDILARQKERNAGVADLLGAFGTEREEMAANWQSLVAKMEKKRGGGPVEVEAGGDVSTVEEAVEKKHKKKEKKEKEEEGGEG